MPGEAKPFLGKDFLLGNDIASALYHSCAANLPIIDYHNHLSPRDIAENRKFNNLTEAWLEGDHYKWRAMRANGIAEQYCTGDAPPLEKFKAWARTVPHTLRNPLYHWAHLELKNYFGIDQLLDESSAEAIYEKCNSMLAQPEFSAQGLLKKMKAEVVCTTDDPADSLHHHEQLARQPISVSMYPSFRPDKSYSFDDPAGYNAYVDRLSSVSGIKITTPDDLLSALAVRIEFFKSLGCRSADHGLESILFDESMLSRASSAFNKIRGGSTLTQDEKISLQAYILFHLSQLYYAAGWVQQFHLGALRSNNSRMLRQAGPDTGFDSIGGFDQATGLSRFLDTLDSRNRLPRTILYNLNPSLNEVFATMAGNFNEGPVPGKIQFGSGWWFLDQKDGMEKQINCLSNMGLLSRFVGMTTDSRSFLSFPRHEYFRRILCNLIGRDVMNGEIPDDLPRLGNMVEGICYSNAKTYFNIT